MTKRLLAILLSLVMIIVYTPVLALANDETQEGEIIVGDMLLVTSGDGEFVYPGPDTWENDKESVHIHTNGLVFSGSTDLPFVLDEECYELTFFNLDYKGDLVVNALGKFVAIQLEYSTIHGSISTVDEEEEGTLISVYVEGDNVIEGNITSSDELTFYGDDSATLSLASAEAAVDITIDEFVIENLEEDYYGLETMTTMTPADDTSPILLTSKITAFFPDEEEFLINDGKPFHIGDETVNIPNPVITDAEGNVLDPQPELEITYFYLGFDEEFHFDRLENVPTEIGNYCISYSIPDENPVYRGGQVYDFSIGHDFDVTEAEKPTPTKAGHKAYYSCNACGLIFADEEGTSPIEDLEAWLAEGGEGYLAPLTTLVAYDLDDEIVEESEDTYETKEDGIHVYADYLTFSGITDKTFFIECESQETNLENIIINNDLSFTDLSDTIILSLENATINGSISAESETEDIYLCLFLNGNNVIEGSITSSTAITFYGEDKATLSFANAKAKNYIISDGFRFENMKEKYVLGETTTMTPQDDSSPVLLYVKTTAIFPDEEEFVINEGNPFPYGKPYEIEVPIVCDENGDVLDPQPDLDIVYFSYTGEYGFERIDDVPTEEGDYCISFFISEDNSDYRGGGAYDFSIGHDMEAIEGLEPTKTEAGYLSYYYCAGCDTYFEDEEGTTPIVDIDAWKAEGGNGYLPPVSSDVLLGDVNEDGEIDMKDILNLRKYIGNIDVTEFNEVNANVNEDDDIDMKDVLMLRKYVANLIEKLGA